MNAVKDVKVVESGFSGGKEARVVRWGGYAFLPMHWRRHRLQASDAPGPETSGERAKCLALSIWGRWKYGEDDIPAAGAT